MAKFYAEAQQCSEYRGEVMHRVLFHRRFRFFTGGHLKVWDYFNHVRSSPDHLPQIHFSADTVWNDSNPWLRERDTATANWSIDDTDMLFFGATDWKMLARCDRRQSPRPIINLIQHVRHSLPTDKRHRFLKYKAIRVCVSEEVGNAIEECGQANGPMFVIPNGIDCSLLAEPMESETRDTEILIAGLKQGELAEALNRRLQCLQRRVEVLTTRLPRSEFLSKMRRSQITVFLPNPTEGFYLPALEGMALGTLVVCPDCVGNRGFCLPAENCLRPEHTEDGILAAVHEALALPQAQVHEMLSRAKRTAAQHSLDFERQRFLEILNNVPQIW